jgi:ABC-2 type transport system ATP-binding protein
MSGGELAVRAEGVGRVYKIKPTRAQKKEGISTSDRAATMFAAASKEVTALAGIDLEIRKGELFGLLGPNGAGKTTLIKILTTLLTPSFGRAFVEGFDVVRDTQSVRERINMVSGGETSGYGLLTVRENLWMFSQFYGIPSKIANARMEELLKILELDKKGNAKVSGLSTGERQRMNFIRGFMTEPTVLFLDEPTLGLDVHAARIVRDFTQRWMRDRPGHTVLLTTHYMAEADALCDRIAIIDHGKVMACDTPANLKKLLQKQPVFEIAANGLDAEKIEKLRSVAGVVRITEEFRPDVMLHDLKFILREESVVSAVVSDIAAVGGGLVGLQKQEPTLEDVFIQLTGRSLKQQDAEA